MPGELIPLVLLPRFTTLVGAGTYATVGMEVPAYARALVNVWRGAMLGTSPTVVFSFEESTDQLTWSTCTDGAGGDPGASTEEQYQPELNKRWFRIKVVLGGTSPAVTCWAIGFLEMRER